MTAAGNSTELVRAQVNRILASPGFVHNDRLSDFLRYLIEQHLEGNAGDLKEALLGVVVFGREPGFDARQDSIVRTEAAKLRNRLAQYYAAEGAADPLIVEIPKGGYSPLVRRPELPPPPTQVMEPRRTRRLLWPEAILAGIAAVAAIAGWSWFHRGSPPLRIAVLPLENLNHDPASDYLADGLTDELIRNLSVIEGLDVRSRTSSFVFKGKQRNIRDAADQLQADYILEGSVLHEGSKLRINAQLVRARQDSPIWSGRFEREMKEVMAVQDEISTAIVNNLRLKFGQGRRRYEVNMEAYDLYLKALSNRSPGERIRLYEQVVAKDSSFAPAWAALGGEYAFRSIQFGPSNTDEVLPRMRLAAAKAIEIDPLLAEAHATLGQVHARDGKWNQAEVSFRRALDLNPNSTLSHRNFAWFLLQMGRVQEAVNESVIELNKDPLSPLAHEDLAYYLLMAGRFDEAQRQVEKTPADVPAVFIAGIRMGQGRTSEAIEILEKNRDGNRLFNEGMLGYAYGRAGRNADAEAVAAKTDNVTAQLLTFAGLRDKDRVFSVLDQIAERSPQRLGVFLSGPELAFLKGDPRVRQIRKKAGLPE